ncbi:MAG: glycosyl hydrolase family [Chloroflexi bacterium]|nr:glycosyl hydrolase family [Chloroflexota bacterium]
MSSLSYCIHAHFYQPPREDPLTGVIPHEIGSAPFSNWNERIHAECYRPNAELRNFEQISFNFGPTLLSWMENHDPDTCRKIYEQDQANVHRHGIGNAIAQAYNHTILPLASYRDKVTQVAWGIADFEYRFKRRPQGMWLPEAAVDMETLEVLARHGIEFTILAPWSARADQIDPTEPYRVNLPGGRSITVFFYQRELSARISFDPGATTNADSFAQYNILSGFQKEKLRRNEPQMMIIASDGELYGHHQYMRDRFLARLVDGGGFLAGMQTTFPALWLQSHPPRQTMEIREPTSWSCHHGVRRWVGDCACTPNDGRWKTRLRYTFEQLAIEIDRLYLEVCRSLVEDPWELNNRYIHVILQDCCAEDLINEMAGRTLTSQQVRRLHLMLEAQRERQRFFTSCGFYFEDFDRIEPKNNVAYAAQAVRLVRLATGVDLEPEVTADLQNVVGQYSGVRADRVFQRHLRRAEGVNSVRIGYAD